MLFEEAVAFFIFSFCFVNGVIVNKLGLCYTTNKCKRTRTVLDIKVKVNSRQKARNNKAIFSLFLHSYRYISSPAPLYCPDFSFGTKLYINFDWTVQEHL